MADPSSAVTKQWDPALTTFSTVDRLRGLVVATTKDDVQLSAVVSRPHSLTSLERDFQY